jgi:DnaJ-class molecular chaperone
VFVINNFDKMFGGFEYGDESDEAEECNDTRLYEVLGIEKSASMDEITKAYKALARKFHPDNKKTGNKEKF